MRRWLTIITPEELMQIATDLGFTGQFRMQALDFIMEQAKSYRWTIEDIQARYGICKHGLRQCPDCGKDNPVEDCV